MSKKMATREAYGKALVELGGKNDKVVVLDADLSKSTKTCDFAAAYPERFVNVGIAEQNMASVAAGLAVAGLTPFMSSFAMFATGRAYEQVRNAIGYPHLNVKIGASHAGLSVGEDGATHQALEDVALMREIPGMTVIVPADANETRQAVLAAAEMDGPVYLRLGRMAVPEVNGEDYQFQVGKGVLLQEGNDVVIFASGLMVSVALEAAAMLAENGIQAAVANLHTIKPLDVDFIVQWAKNCGAVVTAEDHSILGGLGSAVAEVLSEHVPTPLVRVGVQDVFGESAKPAQLFEKYGLTAKDVADACRKVMARKIK